MTFGPDGRLYVAGWTANSVFRYTPTGELVDVFASAAKGGLAAPANVSFGPDGRLYVTAVASRRLFRYVPTTGELIDVIAAPGNCDEPQAVPSLTFMPMTFRR